MQASTVGLGEIIQASAGKLGEEWGSVSSFPRGNQSQGSSVVFQEIQDSTVGV